MSQHQQQHQAHGSNELTTHGNEDISALAPSIDNQVEQSQTQMASDLVAEHQTTKAQTTVSFSPNLEAQEQMGETIGNSPDLNKFHSSLDQNQANIATPNQQVTQQTIEQTILLQADALTVSQAQASSTSAVQHDGSQTVVYERVHPHAVGTYVQPKEVIDISVANMTQQQMTGNAALNMVFEQAAGNDGQQYLVGMKHDKNQSIQVAPMQVVERFSTPQKLAVNSQRSIGACIGEIGPEWQNKMHDQDLAIEKQVSSLVANKEQQFSSEAKLQVNDLNLANNTNPDLMYVHLSKIPQTDQVPAGQRMLSQNILEESHQAQTQNNIIFSEQVNKLSEFQEYDPSDSHSNLQINQQLAQINDLLEDNDEDVHVLNQKEPKMSINQDADDAASLANSSQIPNSTKQPNGSNLIQANLVQPPRGQSSCENALPQFHYQTKPLGAGSNSGAFTSDKVFFVESHNYNGSELVTPQLATRNTTLSHCNLPQSQPGPSGSNIRHPSMDSRQPMQQLGQMEGRGTATHGTHFNDQLNQTYGFNNHPGAIVTSSRKSVYSNQELQKNNYFREEQQRDDQAQISNAAGISLYQPKLDIDHMQFSGQLSQQQIDDQIEATHQAQSYEIIRTALSPQKVESPIIHSVGRSLNLSGLRSQDNFQGQRSENMVRERRLTGDEQNLLGHHHYQLGQSYQQNLNQFPQSAERKQDGFGIRLNCVSEDNSNQQQHSQLFGTSQLSQDQQNNMQKQQQNYVENQKQLKGSNNNLQQYRGAGNHYGPIQGRSIVEQSIDQKHYPQSNRILVDDPQEQQEIENRMSEIQQTSEFNRNKLQGYRAGPNMTNQSLMNYGVAQQQQVFQNMHQDVGSMNNVQNMNSEYHHQQFMAQSVDMIQYKKEGEDRHESGYNQNNMQHQMPNMHQQFYGPATNVKMDEQQQMTSAYSMQTMGKMTPVIDMQHQIMVQNQYYASQSQNYQHQAIDEQQIMRQQHQQQSRIMLENEQQLQAQMSQLHLENQSNSLNRQYQDTRGQLPSQQMQYHSNQLSQGFMTQQMQKNPQNATGDGQQYNNLSQMQGGQQMQSGEILYQQTEMNAVNGHNMCNVPAFYPQGHQMNYFGMQMPNRDTSAQLNLQQQKMQQIQQQVSMHEQQTQVMGQMHQIIHNNNEDIGSQDLQIANPNGFRALQQMAAAGSNELIQGNNSAGTRNFGQFTGQMSKGSDKGHSQIWKQQTFGKSNELSVNLSENLSPDKDNFEQHCDNVLSSSRSSHQGLQKSQSKTAPVTHEMSTSQKSSARKGQVNSGTESMNAALQHQTQRNQKQMGSAQGDQPALIVSRENSKGKMKGIPSRGAASDDDQIHLSSNSHYDSQTSKEYTVLSNRMQKQHLKHSVKDVTATASSQKNQSDGNKRKSSMNKGSSGLGLSATAIPNEDQKDISEDLQHKKQSMQRLPTGKIKSHSNYYEVKSMNNEKISFGKSYNEGSQYSSKNSVKSGGNETGGSANLNQNFERLNQKGVNNLGTNNSNYGRKQSYSQGGSQNRNARSNQRMQLNMQTGSGITNSGQHGGSNQSYDEFIAQIQHDIRMAKGDAAKEFSVLDGNIMKLASKKVGSMFLQDYLKNADQQLINKIIDQVDGKLADLMVGKYGNFFCSKLIEYLQPHQRIHFLKQISGKKFVEISCDEKGTWALQNILHAAMKEEEYRIIEETIMRDDNISRLSKDKQGHHMINLIITSYPEPIREQIFNYICNNFKELAQDQNGLCVMKKIIEYAKKDSAKQKRIVENIIVDSLEYVQHEFGNFVVQEIINLYSFETCKGIYKQMEGHFQRLSLNKFSSKLIETCIDRAPLELQDQIVKEFCSSPCLSKVVQGNFGNFVLQKSIEKYLKSKYNKLELIESIVKCLEEVSDYKVQEKWGDQLLVRYIHSLDTFPHFSEVDSSQKSEQEFKAFMEQKRQVEILLQQKMKVIQEQHQMQKQFIQNQMQGGKPGHYGGYHGGRGGHSNTFTSKYNSQSGHSSGGATGNYINNKHHQKMNNKRGGNKGGQGNQQPHRNSLNAINKDNSGFYDNFNQGGMIFQQNQGKFDNMYTEQNMSNQNQVNTNYVMAQQYGSNNYPMQQTTGPVLPNQNDHFNYPRFDGGQNFNQQQPVHHGDIQNQSVGVMNRPSTGNFNSGPFQPQGGNNMMYQQNRGNDNRNQRGGFYPQNQQQYRGQQNAQNFYQETHQPINQVQGRNSQPHPAQFQKKGKQNQIGQNYKIQKGNAQNVQGHGGQQRRDYKKVLQRRNINFAEGQGNNTQPQARQNFQPANCNTDRPPNMSMQQSAQNSTPNLAQVSAGSDQQLQGTQIGHTMSQQQLEQNNIPSSLFNNDPLGITPNGSSGGTTGRENENELDQ